MQNRFAHNQYKNVQFSTVDRGRLLLMMYDGCLKFLRLSKEGLEAKDVGKFSRFLSKAQAVISELMNTLDFEKGGQIARDLDRLYDFMMFYLTEANIQKDATKIQRVTVMVETIADAYREVILSGQAEREIAQLEGAAIGKAMESASGNSERNDVVPQLRVSY